ncbi:MAG: tRNA-binding protein [Chitinophagales bacterium]|nr:tRNA-binding protein [Chitinophagales bacterium]
MISRNDFEKVEMRVGTVMEVRDFPAARNPSYQLWIDFGEYGIRKSSAQLTKLYSKEDLLNKQVVAVMNLPVKQIGSFFSECLILGTIGQDNTITILQPEQKTVNGLRIG